MRSYGEARRKFGRERDARRSLIKGLVDSLISNESLTTTVPRAREVVSYTERLITKAKLNNLQARRQVISALTTKQTATKLVDELVPKLAGRNSGYFRIQKLDWRRGDRAAMANVSFVDDLSKSAPTKPAPAKSKAAQPVKAAKKPALKKTAAKVKQS